MKFRDISEILKSIDLDKIPMTKGAEKRNGIEYSYYRYSDEQKNMLSKILEIPSFKKKYGEEFKKYLLDTSIRTFEAKNEYYTIQNKLISISESCKFYLENFNEMYPKSNETFISIKLPNTTDLKKLGEYYIKIDKALNQVINIENINGELKFSNVDIGSNWIDISVKTTVATSIIGAIIYAACLIRNENLKYNLMLEEYKKVQIQTSFLEEVAKANEKLINAYVDREVKNIINEYELDKDDKELPNRIKNTIKDFSEMINEGLEVHPAIEAAQSIKTEYPDFKNLEAITSKVKEITDQSQK